MVAPDDPPTISGSLTLFSASASSSPLLSALALPNFPSFPVSRGDRAVLQSLVPPPLRFPGLRGSPWRQLKVILTGDQKPVLESGERQFECLELFILGLSYSHRMR
jgi:hypothetical protein